MTSTECTQIMCCAGHDRRRRSNARAKVSAADRAGEGGGGAALAGARSRRDRVEIRDGEGARTTFLIWQVAELESEARAARDEADAKGAEVKAAKKSLRACADELGRRQAGVRAQCRPPSSYGIWTTFLVRHLDHLPYTAGDASRGRPRSAALAASAHIPAREARGGRAAVVVAVLRLLFCRWCRLNCCAAVVERTPLLPR